MHCLASTTNGIIPLERGEWDSHVLTSTLSWPSDRRVHELQYLGDDISRWK